MHWQNITCVSLQRREEVLCQPPGWGITQGFRSFFFLPFVYTLKNFILIWKSPLGLNEEHLRHNSTRLGMAENPSQKKIIQSTLLKLSQEDNTMLTQLWMNLKWVSIWFHLGNQFM
jgi:hypothetical protein